MTYRTEHDTMGEIQVPADKYWGAQTQRSLQNFQIGGERMPTEIIRAFGTLKKAAALTNRKLGKLPEEKAEIIVRVCDEILCGKLDDHFPCLLYTSLGLYREPVAVCMKKGPDAITAFLGVLYSGCFYVPMDTDMPRGRAEAILSSLLPRAAVYDAQSEKLLLHSDDGMDILRIPYGTASESLCDAEGLERIRRSHIDTDPAYIVYTSGSTGAPKGVCACHRSVIDYIEQLSELLCVNENTVFGNQAPLFTDACLKEIYTVLKHGASAFLIPRMLFSFPVRLVEFLNANKINTICWVSSALTLVSSLGTFEKAKPEFLATIAFGSEVFPARQLDLWRKCLPDARFINLYGPTEATGMSCFYEVDREFAPEEPIPIGCPFPNTEILLLLSLIHISHPFSLP